MKTSFRLFPVFVLMLLLTLLAGQHSWGQATIIRDNDQENTVQTSSEQTTQPVSLDFLANGTVPSSISQLRAMEELVAEVSKKCKPATVNIRVGGSQGSGVVISRDGYILTAAHVIGRPNQTATITFPDGSTAIAKTLGSNPGAIDSGMLKIVPDENDKTKKRWPYMDMGESGTLKEGQWVIAIGHPGGLDEDRGLVVRVGRIIFRNSRLLRTDCALVGGDSGGPLFDMDGKVIGIHSRIGQDMVQNLHVPVDVFSEQWDQLANGTTIGARTGQPRLGINVVGRTNEVREVTDGPAKKAGIKKGDIIIEMDGVAIENKADIGRIFKEFEIGDQVEIVVKRGDEEKSFELLIESS